ncbi:hypothetical protein DM01DRAFT_1380891 [Hesseltinella vesiculosa]|uniref:Peptidase M20 domain-containing protein 2 n=1 Tax=Hesseltinella vesiculosa TaxID=101127 RepID=A0A1X2GT17_9FUNG|nr:hypothetical protein DM01DRAFT_1380891 [Hesseltinella vesiculosa]
MCHNHEAEAPKGQQSEPPAHFPSIEKALPHLHLDCSYQEADDILSSTIDDIAGELREISLKIHEQPEVGMTEHKAHALLADFMESKGFQVVRQAYGMETAFTAEFSNGDGRRIGVCSEYDSLPEIGHACGHNLIAISGVATALALKALLEQGKAKGKVILFGTPAEEVFIGKIEMVHQSAFKDNVDLCVMAHPAAGHGQYIHMLASQDVRVEFRGQPTHASASPWAGVNALDAIVQVWNNISMMRQQLEPTDRVHGIFTKAGDAPNIIPDHTAGWFYVRTHTYHQIHRVKSKLEDCFEAAARATGCKVSYQWTERGPAMDMIQNTILADTYAYYMEKEGVTFPPKYEQEKVGLGSTDMGNVSYSVPSIHPMFGIHTSATNHTREFTAAAKTEQAHKDTLLASKALAMTASKALLSQGFFDALKDNFEATVAMEDRQ